MSTTHALAYDLTGSGPLVVLIHGVTENRASWDPFMPELTSRYHVLRVDLRGHGESLAPGSFNPIRMAEDLRAIVALVEDPAAPAIVVGHAFGALVATAYGAAFSAAAIINIDMALALGTARDLLYTAAAGLRGDNFDETIRQLAEQNYGETPLHEQERLEALRKVKQDVVLATWGPMLGASNPLALVQLVEAMIGVPATTPYVTIFGRHPGPGYEAWLEDVIPHAVTEDWGRIGHYPHLVHPQRFINVIDRLALR